MNAQYPLPLRRLADHGHWELILRDPGPRLRPWVYGSYQGYLESGKRRIFNRATRLLERDIGERWADIAYECGYYDQAHLIRDFRDFAGSTPSDLLAHRLPHAGLAAD